MVGLRRQTERKEKPMEKMLDLTELWKKETSHRLTCTKGMPGWSVTRPPAEMMMNQPTHQPKDVDSKKRPTLNDS